MNKLLLAAATLLALAAPAHAQAIDDATLESAAMLTLYSKHCKGEVKSDYQQAIKYAIAQQPARFNQLLSKITDGLPHMGAPTFCSRMEADFASALKPASDPFKNTSEMDVIIASGMAIMQAHMNCGGYVAPQQVAAFQRYMEKNSALVAKMADVFKGATCEQTAKGYKDFMAQAAKGAQ
jgi:hypothetical protein